MILSLLIKFIIMFISIADHPPRMKGAPSGRSRWPHGHGNQATQGNLFEEITQNQLDLLGKIASREQIEEQQAQSYDAPPAEESTSFEMNVQPKFGGTGITGLDPITLKRLANAAHGMHGRDPAAVAALAALQQSGGGRAEGGTRGGGRGGGAVAAVGGGGRGRGREAVKKRVAPAIERKTEKKATTAKPVAKKDFGGPPRPAQRSTVSVTQRGRGLCVCVCVCVCCVLCVCFCVSMSVSSFDYSFYHRTATSSISRTRSQSKIGIRTRIVRTTNDEDGHATLQHGCSPIPSSCRHDKTPPGNGTDSFHISVWNATDDAARDASNGSHARTRQVQSRRIPTSNVTCLRG